MTQTSVGHAEKETEKKRNDKYGFCSWWFMVSSKHTIGIHQHGDIFPARTQLTFMFKK